MTFRACAVDGFYFVRWLSGVPEDLDAITAAVAARRAELEHPLVYVSIQDADSRTPDEAFVRHVLTLVPEFFEQLTRVYLVVAVRGLGGNLHKKVLRAALATARTIDPERTGKVTLVDSLADLFTDLGVGPERRAALERRLAEAQVLPGGG